MEIDSTRFVSGGLAYSGVRFAPSRSSGKRPGLLMLHGFPGAEKNVDIARALTARGWVCWLPHFRGSWGSSGLYSFSGVLEDTARFWTRMKTDPRVNPRKVAILGFSMGGWAALNLASRHQDVRAVAALAPMAGSKRWFNARSRQKVAELAEPIQAWPAPRLWADFKTALPVHDPLHMIGNIAPRSLLLVHGTQDELVPFSLSRELYAQAGRPKRLVAIKGADHCFSEHRNSLLRAVVPWLSQVVR